MRISTDMVEKSSFIKKYRKRMVRAIQRIDPTITKKEIETVVNEMICEQGFSPNVTLDNNYTYEQRESTLLSVLDWTIQRKPIIAGNATFYKNQNEEYNPAANMLDRILAKRKSIKKKMFTVENVRSRLYQDLDRKQGNEKINANSYYGGSGAKTSSFYSKYSGPATTLSAQSVISTTQNMFEAFLADNYNFLNFEEWFDWIDCVLTEYEEEHQDLDISFLHPISHEELAARFCNHVIKLNDEEREMIVTAVSHFPEELVPYLYYKNNMIRFIKDHPMIQSYILAIFEKTANLTYISLDDDKNPVDPNWIASIPKEYRAPYESGEKKAKDWNSFVNHKYFIDPNNPPEEIRNDLEILNQYMYDFVYTRYMAFDRIYRLKNFERDVVTVIDTDSNILSLDTIMEYLIETFFKDRQLNYYGRNFLNNVYIAINMITYFITYSVNDILLSYGKYANIPEEHRKRYNMKNEFMFGKLIIGETKKRYISSILLREGNIMNPPKVDIKGFDFKKATCSEYAESIYKGIIKRRVLDCEGIDLHGMQKDVYQFRDEIRQSIERGDKRFLPNGNAKELAGYKNPNTVSTVKAVQAWNIIHPDNPIEPPTKVSILKMNIFKEDDIKPLKKTHPEIYERIMDGIFNDTTGMFVKKEWVPTEVHFVYKKSKDWWKEIPQKYRKEYKEKGQRAWNNFVADYDGTIGNGGYYTYTCKGLLVLAIPPNENIPEWAIPYIDMTTMVNNILAPFIPVLKIFKFKTLEEGKTRNGVDRKTEGLSRMVKF